MRTPTASKTSKKSDTRGAQSAAKQISARCAEFEEEADESICAMTPEPFYAVGLWYGDFSQTSDEEVRTILRRAAEGQKVAVSYEV